MQPEKKTLEKTSVNQVLFRTGIIFFLSLVVAFLSIYLVTKKEITNRNEQELLSINELIKQSMKSTYEATKTLEQLVDLRLYTKSQALAEDLAGKTINEISDEELHVLKEKWDLSEISLFVFEENGDLIVKRSTDPREIGLNAKDWDYWYVAMKELFEGKPISISKGYAEKNYWVGPLSKSEVVDKYYKYGYYYDGSTDFIINPFLDADYLYKFSQKGGSAQLIEKIQEGYENISEIAIINIPAYLRGDKNKIIEPMTDIPVIYGKYVSVLKEDEMLFKKSLNHELFEKVIFEQNGVSKEKVYISLPDERILTIVIENEVPKEIMKHLLIVFILIFFITIVSIIVLSKIVTRKPLKLLGVERERLQVAEEFKRTIELLPSAIYKCGLNSEGHYYFIFREGMLWEEFNENSKDGLVCNSVPKHVSTQLIAALETVYREGRTEFTFEHNNMVYHNVLKAVYDIEHPNKIVEVAGYANDITDRLKADQEVHHMAMHDSLTSLPNRFFFSRQLDTALTCNKDRLAVLFLDFDNFKQVNDTLGHDAGDFLLVKVSEILKDSLLQKGFLARMGGDEFTILLSNYTKKEEIEQLCERISQNLKNPIHIMGQEIFNTVSIGISIAPNDGQTSKELLKNADSAMYVAKNKGKNNYEFYNDSMNQGNLRKMKIQQELHQALKQSKEQLYLVYQPQLNLETNEVIGVEALLRWTHPKMGMITPTEFIPIAEESGLIIPLGDWVFHEACQQLSIWNKQEIGPLRMSINLSAQQFKKQDLLNQVKRIVEATGINPSYLTLEITESTCMEDITHTIQVMNQLHQFGVKMAIDDFGTGYSSLKYLKDFPINELKIDRSFIKEMGFSSAGKAIVKSIIEMGSNLELQIMAEGVESKKEIDLLLELGCTGIQGYYFSKPVMPEEIESIVKPLYSFKR